MLVESSVLHNQVVSCIRGLALAASLFSFTPAATAEVIPIPEPLPPLPGDDGGIAFAINNKGEVAGVSVGADGSTTAVKWDLKGQPTALPPLSGDPQSMAVGINLRGEVAGNSGDDLATTVRDGVPRNALRWDRSGQPQALPPLPGDTVSFAAAINNNGEVVGTSYGPDGSSAVIWDRDGVPRALEGGKEGVAINNRGMVAGLGVGGVTLWGHNGHARTLTLPGPACDDKPAVMGITSYSEVLGNAKFLDDYCAPVRWNKAGEAEFLELIKLEGEEAENWGLYAVAYGNGIEQTGEVVGWTITDGAAVWDRSGSLILLPPQEGADGAYAWAINNHGVIAGASFGPGIVSGEQAFLPTVWR